MKNHPPLTIIQSTHASVRGLDSSGLLERHRRLMAEYAKFFSVTVYSSDPTDYSFQLGVKHQHIPLHSESFGISHLVYYIWLVFQSPKMRGVIKVFGSNIPTLPIIKQITKCPMMVTYQFDYSSGMRLGEKSRLKKWLSPAMERLSLLSADLVAVTTAELQEKVQKKYRKRTVLLPNWIDLNTLKNLDRDGNRECGLILYAGRLHWQKGVEVLINSFAEVKRYHPKARLLICGTGDEYQRLRTVVGNLCVSDVVFAGRLPNIEILNLMRSAQIFVLPTLTMEGHPKALIEAMACGTACIGTDIPGINNIIDHEDTGLLVPPSDVNALSNALQRLLGDSDFRSFLGRSAEIYAEQFDFRQIVTQEIEVLKTLRSNFVR